MFGGKVDYQVDYRPGRFQAVLPGRFYSGGFGLGVAIHLGLYGVAPRADGAVLKLDRHPAARAYLIRAPASCHGYNLHANPNRIWLLLNPPPVQRS